MSVTGMVTKNKGPFWRGKVGLIVPSNNTVCESDFHKLAPEAVSVHTARMMILGDINEPVDWEKPSNWDEAYQRMHDKCEEAAKELATARVSIMSLPVPVVAS